MKFTVKITLNNQIIMAVTKEIVAYKSYKENGYEVRVYDDGKQEFWMDGQHFDRPPINPKYKEGFQPILDFIEKDLSHSFTPATDEFED